MTDDASLSGEWTSGPRQALGYHFDVRVLHDGPVATVRDYLAPFPVHDGHADTTYTVRGTHDDGTFDVDVDGRLIADRVPGWRAVALLGWHLNQSVVEHGKARYTLLHAAAAARGDCAVLLPAPMENGKTTTVTGLVRAGFSYLTDEAAALDPTTLRVTSYPKPLTIDRGSWHLFPELAPAGADPEGGSWWVPADDIRHGATIPSAQPCLVVFPAYRPDSVTTLLPLGPSAAVMRLAESTFAFAADGARNLATLALLVRSAPVYELTIGDLDTAVTLISGLVDERTEGGVNILHGHTVLVPVDGLSVEEFDDGVVIWEPKGGRLHLLDVPGRELWARLGQERQLAEVFAETGRDFGVDAEVIRRDAMPFLSDLVAKGLLVDLLAPQG